MGRTRRIEFLNFNMKENPELMGMLNAVAPYEYITVHALAQKIMLMELKNLMTQYGISMDSIQPTCRVG